MSKSSNRVDFGRNKIITMSTFPLFATFYHFEFENIVIVDRVFLLLLTYKIPKNVYSKFKNYKLVYISTINHSQCAYDTILSSANKTIARMLN